MNPQCQRCVRQLSFRYSSRGPGGLEMEIKKPLDRENGVVFGTVGGPGPTGVPNTTAAAEGSGESGSRVEAARQQRPDPAVPE